MKRRFTILTAALALLVFMTPSMVGWGQTRGSITLDKNNITSINSGSGYAAYDGDHAIGTVTTVTTSSVMINSQKLQFRKSGGPAGYLYNKTAMPGNITKITLSDNVNLTIYVGTSSNPSTTTVTSGAPISGSYTYFAVKNNSTSALSTASITIEYSDGGSTGSINFSDPSISVNHELHDYETFSGTFSNISSPNFQVQYYQSAEENAATISEPSWIQTYVWKTGTNGVEGYCYIEANSDDQRYAYFKVYSGTTYSNLITVTQSAAPAPTYTVTLSGNSINADYQGNVTSSTITVSTNLTGNEIVYEIYYNNSGTYSSTNPYSDWLLAEVNANDEIECTIDDNLTGTARPAQFKVYAYDDNYDEAYSEVITLTQAAQPQVATPTFSPAAGAVASGTEVSISCATENATIYYTVNNVGPTEYTTPIILTEATTIEAYASATGYRDSEIVEAEYTIRGDAVFVNGVYTEPFDSQESFDKWSVYSVSGDDDTWEYTSYGAYIKGNSHNNEDWLISPKMAVDNGNLYISFDCVGRYGNAEMITVLYSTDYPGSGNPTSYTWTALTTTPDIPYSSSNWNFESVSCNISATTDVYFAFKYTSTASSSGTFEMKPFTARQCHTLTVSNLVGVNTFVFAGSESETLFEGEGSAPVGVGVNVMVSVDVIEGYDIQSLSLLVNGVEHVGDIDGGMYLFDMPNQDVTITATATRLPYHTVTFTTNGITEVIMEVIQDQSIGTQPEANEAYIPAGFEFVGWYDDDYENTNTAPNYITFPYTPTSDVTLKAVFAEATVSGSASLTKMTSNETFEVGDKVVIVASDNVASDNVAMYQETVSSSYVNKYTFVNNVETVAADDKNWFTVSAGSANNTWKLGDATNGYVYTSGSNNLKVDTENSTNFTLAWDDDNSKFTLVGNGRWLSYRSDLSSNKYFRMGGVTSSSPSGIAYFDIYKYSTGNVSYSNYRTSLTETSNPLVITGYGQNAGGYYLIASPVYVSPSSVTNMLANSYDLYYFDQNNDLEWRNYKQNAFNLEPGKGYLYANSNTVSLTFTGTAYNGTGEITLTQGTGKWANWNLIGNPWTNDAILQDGNGANANNVAYYTMNQDGDELAAGTTGATIAAMNGVFVEAATDGQVVYFNEVASAPGGEDVTPQLSLNITKNRGCLIDRAIVRFDEGGVLHKFQLNPNNTKIYITEANQDYAVVRGANEGELPVNFKAKENGTYTLSVNIENVEMNYLHLIDNMTGADIDLLQTPSYTFEANTNDYANRFKLVFAANSTDEADESSFAFFSNGNLIVNNEGNATLQVIDINGRILSSETISGSCSKAINATTGVYMLRLINGENVKVQKVVVR